jgi:hypothetical protein
MMSPLKMLSTVLAFVFLTSSVQSWSLPFLPSTIGGTGKEIFSISAVVGAALLIAPLSTPAIDVSGSYNDPNHPNCLRVIEVKKGSLSEFTLTGTDGNPGCSPDGIGDKSPIYMLTFHQKVDQKI